MKVTFEEFIHAVNILGEEVNVGAHTLVPPVEITPEGRKQFKDALAAEIEVRYEEYYYRGIIVSPEDENLERAVYNFVEAKAGYCWEVDFSKWFEGENAELI